MYTTFGFRNLEREAVSEEGWRHIASNRRDR